MKYILNWFRKEKECNLFQVSKTPIEDKLCKLNKILHKIDFTESIEDHKLYGQYLLRVSRAQAYGFDDLLDSLAEFREAMAILGYDTLYALGENGRKRYYKSDAFKAYYQVGGGKKP